MMPHLGVLSTVYPEAAWSIFDKDCLIKLGTIVAPAGKADEGEYIMDLKLEMPDGRNIEEKMKFGEIKRVLLGEKEEAQAVISPHKGFDIGAGPGKQLETKIEGGVVGMVIDARGRPLSLPADKPSRDKKIVEWIKSLELYPEDQVKGLLEG
jgi:hypothetical protein